MAENVIRVLIVDDHELVRDGLSSVLSNFDDIQVVGTAADGESALQRARTADPDVVVLDVRMPGLSGVETCRLLKEQNPDVHVIMLTSYSDEEAIVDSLVAGADGYTLKHVGSDELVRSIRTIASGQSALAPAAAEVVVSELRRLHVPLNGRDANLTPQESRIVPLVAQGMTNREIGALLQLSEATVRNYISNVLTKLDLENRTQLAVYAAQRGLLGESADAEPGNN